MGPNATFEDRQTANIPLSKHNTKSWQHLLCTSATELWQRNRLAVLVKVSQVPPRGLRTFFSAALLVAQQRAAGTVLIGKVN